MRFESVVDEIFQDHLVDFELIGWVGTTCVCHLRRVSDAAKEFAVNEYWV